MQVVLVMFKANGQRKDFKLKKPDTIIGRGNESDLRIPLAVVSRKHCELAIVGDSLTVEDLGSSNGTLVNNRRIKESVALKPGDTITVGPVVFTVTIDGQPETVKPVRTVIVESSVEPVQTASMEDSATIDVDLSNDDLDSSGSFAPPSNAPSPKPKPQ